jgi:NADPH:quinone reductase-like Zn-dependent oxidoreductase
MDFAVGQEIFGMNSWFAEGAFSVPISALTAWQGLFDRGGLRRAERVLIHGGAGAVGMFAVQLAHMHGAHVITTVSANNIDFVKALGADEALDYRGTPFEDCVGEIDLVLDTVGPDIVRRSWRLLRQGGRLVTVAVESKWAADERIRDAFFIFEQDKMQLEQVARLLEAGQLQPALDSVVPVSAAIDAYAGNTPKRRPGKLVMSMLQWSALRTSAANTVRS